MVLCMSLYCMVHIFFQHECKGVVLWAIFAANSCSHRYLYSIRFSHKSLWTFCWSRPYKLIVIADPHIQCIPIHSPCMDIGELSCYLHIYMQSICVLTKVAPILNEQIACLIMIFENGAISCTQGWNRGEEAVVPPSFLSLY